MRGAHEQEVGPPPIAPPISGIRHRFSATDWTRKETEPQVIALRHTP
jgi:hypothetical protein